MRYLQRIGPLLLLAVCLGLPATVDAGYDKAFLTLTPSADTLPFSWAYDHASTTSPSADPDSVPPSDSPTDPPTTTDPPAYNVAAWHTYIKRVIVPSLRTALATRLTQPIPVATMSHQDDLSTDSDVPSKDSTDPFIEIIIPLESASPDPPIAMHVQLLLPEQTLRLILEEAAETASSPDHIQRTKAFQTYLDNVTETLQDEATVQQYFRTASLTSSLLSVAATFAQVIALGTVPLHALFTTIPLLMYYVVSTALGEDPLAFNWTLFSSASNSLLRTTFSDTLIPVP